MTHELTAESVPRRTRDRQSGFSLIETLIVVLIGMILMAFAIPMVQSAVRSYTLNAAASNVSRMVQQARYTAISQGSDACTVFAGSQFGIDADCNGALASTPQNPEVRMQVPIGVTLSTTSTISTASMPFPTAPTELPGGCTSYAVTFNTRGSKTSVCGTATGGAVTNILFLTGWGNTNAVTITGTGRAKSWRYDGANWQ